MYGKQGEAIRHLEILRQQQEALPPQEQFAQTYVFLGNLYQSQNDIGKASEVWKAEADLFPESRDLQKRVAALPDAAR